MPTATPNFRTFDLNLLRVFDEVMAERSLTRAAQQLAMTQPAVSNAMKRLRDTLQDELVQRSGFGIAPTPRALALWPNVRAALQSLEQTLSPGEFDPAHSDQTFVLAMADATAAELMPGLVEAMQRHAPSVSMRVLPLTTRDPRRILADGQLDLAVGHFPAVLADITAQAQAGQALGGAIGGYAHDRLYDGEYVCVMRQNHPLAIEPKLSIDAFCAAQHLLVSFSGRAYGFVDEALAGLSRQRRIVLTVNQFFTAGRVVARSDLLTVLPKHFVRVANSSGDLLVRDLPFAVPKVYVDSLWHRRSSAAPAHRWLRQQVIHAAAQVFAATAPALQADSQTKRGRGKSRRAFG